MAFLAVVFLVVVVECTAYPIRAREKDSVREKEGEKERDG